MKKIIWSGSMIAIIVALVGVTIYFATSNERVLKQFAAQLFQYPLPEDTALISKHQFNGKNFLDGGGSGGYWNVVAIMELSSSLSEQEVLQYYQDAELFLFPDSERRGVELELYFVQNSEKIAIHSKPSEFYYRDMDKRIRTVDSYPYPVEAMGSTATQQQGQTEYILQLTSGFDYFWNWD